MHCFIGRHILAYGDSVCYSFIPSVFLVCVYVLWLEDMLAEDAVEFTYHVTDELSLLCLYVQSV